MFQFMQYPIRGALCMHGVGLLLSGTIPSSGHFETFQLAKTSGLAGDCGY